MARECLDTKLEYQEIWNEQVDFFFLRALLL